jgi:branched-chain amino acid transport system ATP-binding protein
MTTRENKPGKKDSRQQERQPQINADERRYNNNKKSASISVNPRQKKEEPKILRIERIFSGYQKRNVLKGISLEVEKGEVVAVIGKNGAGKSTLLKAIMGFLPVEEGNIYLNDTCITNKPPYIVQRKRVGYFMQGGRVFPHLTVRENLEVGGNGLTKKDIKNKIDRMSEMLPFLKSRSLNMQAAALSGGERHQLSLGMVLMNDLDLLLLDEPSAGLSPLNVDKMYELLEGIKSEMALSMLLIEQKVTEAVKFSDRVCLLKNGKIEKEERSKSLESIEDIGTFFFGGFGQNGLA